ncbi:MAG: hypothetical protein KGZ97_03560 [Bacteroidetes bacterium]|nr:hypothetical protein [Bacteroidota bacterium]
MSGHRKADHDYQTTIAMVISVARKAKTMFEKSSDVAGKRAFLDYILQNPTVNEKTLGFTLRSPFNLILELTDSPLLGSGNGTSASRRTGSSSWVWVYEGVSLVRTCF